MKIFSGKEISVWVDGIIKNEMQVQKTCVDLTVGKICAVTGRGRIDFSGEEFKHSPIHVLQPEKENPDDAHGWWKLSKGVYLFEFNEFIMLPENATGYIVPHARLLQSGVSHYTIVVTGTTNKISIPVNIPETGIDIKENSRVSSLLVIGQDFNRP